MASNRTPTTGIKALISAAALGVTVAGWAVLGSQAAAQAQAQAQTQAQVSNQTQTQIANAGPVSAPVQAAPLPTRTAPAASVPASPRVVTAPRVIQQPSPLFVTRSSR